VCDSPPPPPRIQHVGVPPRIQHVGAAYLLKRPATEALPRAAKPVAQLPHHHCRVLVVRQVRVVIDAREHLAAKEKKTQANEQRMCIYACSGKEWKAAPHHYGRVFAVGQVRVVRVNPRVGVDARAHLAAEERKTDGLATWARRSHISATSQTVYNTKGTRAHTHRELIRKWNLGA